MATLQKPGLRVRRRQHLEGLRVILHLALRAVEQLLALVKERRVGRQPQDIPGRHADPSASVGAKRDAEHARLGPLAHRQPHQEAAPGRLAPSGPRPRSRRRSPAAPAPRRPGPPPAAEGIRRRLRPSRRRCARRRPPAPQSPSPAHGLNSAQVCANSGSQKSLGAPVEKRRHAFQLCNSSCPGWKGT